MKVKFCQFDLQRLYCTSVVLSGKLFRIKTWLRLNSTFVNWLCKSKISQMVYSLRRWRFYFLPPPPRDAVKKVSNAPSYAAAAEPHLGENHLLLLNTHVHLGVHSFLLGMSIASLSKPFWVEPSLAAVIKILRFFFESTPLDWTYFRLKTATLEVLINDKFPPEPSFLILQNETQLASSETWAWRYQFSVSRTNIYTPTECSYSDVLRPWMEYLITRILKATE